MAIEEKSYVPGEFSAGETVKVLFILDPDTFPVGNSSVTAAFSGPEKFQVDCTVDSAGAHLVLVASLTESKTPGEYYYSVRAQNAATGDALIIARGLCLLKKTAFSNSPPTAKAILVQNLEDAVNALSKKTRSSVSINGKSYTLSDLPALFSLLQKARADLRNEENALIGNRNGRIIKTHFGECRGDRRPFNPTRTSL